MALTRRLREERYQHYERLRHHYVLDRSNPMEDLDSDQFTRRFRLNKATAAYVIDLICEEICANPRRGPQLPASLQFLIALRFYATGTFQSVTGDIYSVSQQTCSNIVKRVSKALARRRTQFVKFPMHDDAPAVRRAFAEVCGFRGVTGLIDGTHVRIERPTIDNSELYRNRKDYFSINVQVVCDATMMMTSIGAYWYGSAHDSRIWENSNLYIRMQQKQVPGVLLGDSGYPCSRFLLTPVGVPTTFAERNYNRAHIVTRNIIERLFGVWKREFACLRGLRLRLSTTLLVINACAVLHNIRCKCLGPAFADDDENDEDDERQAPYPGDDGWDDRDVRAARSSVRDGGTTVRDAVIAQQFSV